MLIASYASGINYFVIGVFAYLLTITLAGMITAYILKKCGDATAIELGFGEFNPPMFVDMYGALSFLFLGVGWGKGLPLVVTRLPRSYFPLRFFWAVYADFFAYIFISFVYACMYVISLHVLDKISSFNNLIIQFFVAGLLFSVALTILRFFQKGLRYTLGLYYWFNGTFNEYVWQEIGARASLIAFIGVYFFLSGMAHIFDRYVHALIYAAAHLFGYV